jgi:integrase
VRTRPVKPWSISTVKAMVEAIDPRFRVLIACGAGLGLRQGELFGLSPDDLDVRAGLVRIDRQVKLFRSGKQVFAPPKGQKTRTVPLPASMRALLREHEERCPSREVTLPWGDLDGRPTTVGLYFTDQLGRVLQRNRFNLTAWKPAQANAGIDGVRENGCHALRHHYASVLLDAGESIKALSEYLGHHDPGFTLRTYTHLMPNSEARTRRAVDGLWLRATNVPSQAA